MNRRREHDEAAVCDIVPMDLSQWWLLAGRRRSKVAQIPAWSEGRFSSSPYEC